jgi:hypothetical protein
MIQYHKSQWLTVIKPLLLTDFQYYLANLNIIGATLTDDYANNQTTITIDQPLKASSFMLMGA